MFSGDINVRICYLSKGLLISPRQELHRLIDSFIFTSLNRQVAPLGSTECKNNSIIFLTEFRACDINANINSSAETSSFLLHLRKASVDNVLLHFEFWNAISKKATDLIRAFVDDDCMTSASKLLCCGKACWPGSDHCNSLSCDSIWRKWLHIT